jgi:ribonuclease HII
LKVAIFGQGYVGLTLSIAAAQAGHNIIGFDINKNLIADLLNGSTYVPGIDSKKLSEKSRFKLKEIIEKDALAWEVAFVDNHKIDEINILNASFLAMNMASENLNISPELLLIDGNRFKSNKFSFKCFVKGDGKYLSIAAASILAKTYRDLYMDKLDLEFPMYKWSKNKGYPTREHCEGIEKHGYTKHHRKSFVVKSLYQTKLAL